MFARVSTYQGPTDGPPDEVIEQASTAVRKIDGARGVCSLLDRTTGKALSITLWDTEEAMKASEDAANRIRSEAAGRSGTDVVSIERFEVVRYELIG